MNNTEIIEKKPTIKGKKSSPMCRTAVKDDEVMKTRLVLSCFVCRACDAAQALPVHHDDVAAFPPFQSWLENIPGNDRATHFDTNCMICTQMQDRARAEPAIWLERRAAMQPDEGKKLRKHKKLCVKVVIQIGFLCIRCIIDLIHIRTCAGTYVQCLHVCSFGSIVSEWCRVRATVT